MADPSCLNEKRDRSLKNAKIVFNEEKENPQEANGILLLQLLVFVFVFLIKVSFLMKLIFE